MKKVKVSFAKVLACVFLLFCVLSYNINISALSVMSFASTKADQHTVCLEASFAQSEDLLMKSNDGVNFSLTKTLERGNYQLRIIDNGIVFGHPGTIYDTTAAISASGWRLSESINAHCTLLATGGTYTFAYNTDTNKLQIIKAGLELPDTSGESLKVNVGNTSFYVNIGDIISYELYLKAEDIFEDIQSILSYNENKLSLVKVKSDNPELTDMEAEALENCPNLQDAVYNSAYDGVVAVNGCDVKGYDFTTEKLFLSLDFLVTGTGETNIEFTIQEMTRLGGNASYFIFSSQCAEGVSLRGYISITKAPKPTEPTSATQPEETTEPQSSAPESEPVASEATESTTFATEPIETSTSSEPLITEPTETTAEVPLVTTEPAETTTEVPTVSTEPQEITTELPSFTTEPAEATTEATSEAKTEAVTETTAPKSEYDLGDVNCDGKLNIRDATLIQKYIAKITCLSDQQIALADYNPDGKVNIKDATLIQKKIANLI